MAAQGMLLSDVALTAPPSAVLRRYSDFLWLYEKLHMERAGAIVPPLPDKQPVGRFNSAFVEERRVHLERFLRRVATHPELADASSLDLFLRADDVTFHAAKSVKGGAGGGTTPLHGSGVLTMHQYYPGAAGSVGGGPGAATTKKEGIKRWFAEAKTSVTGALASSPDDDLFEEIARYVAGLDAQMRNVSQQATILVRKGKEIANGLFEFGLAFNLLGQSEADALGTALSNMGETADRLSVLSAEHAEREMREFEEPLQDYIKTIHAVKLALQRRHEKRLSYSTCLADVESKHAQLGKLRMQIGSEAKAYSTEMALRRAHEASEVAREEYAAVSQRVLREVDRFKREKAEDMRRVVLDYINLQVEYNKRMEEIWATLIPKLEAVQLDAPQLPPPHLQQQQQPPHLQKPPQMPPHHQTYPLQQQQQLYPPHAQIGGPNLNHPISPDSSPQRTYANVPLSAGGMVGPAPPPPAMPSQPPPPVPPPSSSTNPALMYGASHVVPTPDPHSTISVQYRDPSTLPGM